VFDQRFPRRWPTGSAVLSSRLSGRKEIAKGETGFSLHQNFAFLVSSIQKRVYEAHFLQIQKSKHEFVADWFMLAGPKTR
jgi:hypothetical protein